MFTIRLVLRLVLAEEGALTIGVSRSATEIVYNVSKKTVLKLTQIAIIGTNAATLRFPPPAIRAQIAKTKA